MSLEDSRIEMRDRLRLASYEVVEAIRRSRVNEAVADPFARLNTEKMDE